MLGKVLTNRYVSLRDMHFRRCYHRVIVYDYLFNRKHPLASVRERVMPRDFPRCRDTNTNPFYYSYEANHEYNALYG
jgi:hypothetical protein